MIPADWEVKRLQEGIELFSGQHVLARHCNTEGKGVPYITGPADFPHGTIQHTKFTEMPTTVCRSNDILVTVKGSGAGTMILSDAEYCISRQLMAVRVTEWRTPYIFALLVHDRILFGAAATGLIPGLSRVDILTKRIVIPPDSEQRAIAGALSDVDALIASLDKLIAKKRDIKQAAMQQLLTGKKRLPAFDTANGGYKQTEIGVIPEDWAGGCLGERARKVGSGITPTGGERVYKNEGRPFLRSQNVGWGTLLLEDLAFIDDETHEAFKATEIQVDDVFLNITGASIGRSAVADTHVARGNVNQHVCIIRTSQEQLHPRFLSYFLLSSTGQRQIDSFQAGGNRQGLNFGQIRSFQLPIPPIAEQRAVATVLSDMDAELAALEQRRDKTRALKLGMMQELLTGNTRLV
jgi:type I restriction enzyme S subunit